MYTNYAADEGCNPMIKSALDSPVRVNIHSMEETIQLNCPICKDSIRGRDNIMQHLISQHGIGKRQARFFSQKLVEWRQSSSNFILSLQNRQKSPTCDSDI